MNKILLICVILALCIGCGHAEMIKITFDKEGNLISMNRVEYKVMGSRSLKGLNVNIDKGIVKIDKQSADSGKLGDLLKNAGKIMAEAGKLITAGAIGGNVVK